ncbi:MAG: hypothetical protein HQK78_13725 [Desulfobacterales bacterium]|nr:hypothetical protein [Desulfobacterales bacterium]
MEYIKKNTETALKIGADAQGISIEDARKLYEWTKFTSKVTVEDIKSMEDDQNFMLKNETIRNKINIYDIIDKIALE